MNARCFKTVFSKRLGARVAVGEHACSQGKANGATASGDSPSADTAQNAAAVGSHSGPWGFWGALSSSFALVTLAWASPAWAQPAAHALPTGGQVVQGAVQFNQSAQQLNIQQSTDRAAVNWQSFDIGSQAKVQVHQPSAQSVLLNRVGGESPSQIFGQLQANGKVILVNPNGLVIGRDGSVSAAGFTGSTLNISDADFMTGQARFNRSGAAHGSVLNQGRITAAPGGYVALLGASVSNEGAIEAPQGHVFLAAADGVNIPSELPGPGLVGVPLGSSGRIRLELTPASISAAVANQQGGTIVTEGGQVYLQAAALNQALATVLQSGSIDTTGVQGGQVHVLADGGRIRVDGQIKANSTNGTAGGDIYIGRDKDTNVLAAVGDASGAHLETLGGFVETSGAFLKVDSITVKAKEWLLDPNDIIIGTSATTDESIPAAQLADGVSHINATDLSNALTAGTNVTVETNIAATGGDGDITVAALISNTSAGNKLTLKAHRNIVLNNSIDVSSIELNAGTGSVSGSGNLSASDTILINSATNGTLTGNISGSGSVVKTGAGTVTFSGKKNYSGGTNVNAGRLVGIDGGGGNTYNFESFGSGEINIQSGATAFVNNRSGTSHNYFINKISGEGTLEISGPNPLGNARTMVTGDFSNMSGTIALLHNNTQLIGVNTTAAVRVDTGASLNVWNTHALPVIGALNGSGRVIAVVNGTGTLTVGNGGGSGTFNGQITSNGTINITKIGSGTQTLTGNNTYTGETKVDGGTLAVQNIGSFRSSLIAIASGATFEANVSNNTTYGGVTRVSGEGNFRKTGAGNLTLSNGTSQLIFGTTGSSTPVVPPPQFNGLLNINQGSIQNDALKGAFLNNAGTININQDAWLDIRGETVQMKGLTGGGNIINTWNDTNVLIFGVGALETDNFIYNGVIGAATGSTPSIAINVTKSGSGTQVLAGDNLYAGTTIISGGTLQVGNGGATGTLGAGAVSLSSKATLHYSRSTATTIGNSISGAGNLSATVTGATSDLNVSSAVNLTDGTINLSTDGNLTLSQNLTTTNFDANAIVLNAGAATNAGSSTGGDIRFIGSGAVNVGSGGRATLYTGSLSGSTGLGITTGNSRYNSDEQTSNFTAALGSGAYAIYREAPTLNVRFNDANKTYDAQAFTGGNGLSVVSGLVNGDTSTAFSGISYSGTSQNATNAGTYAISGTALNSQGYALSYANGTLTINKKDVTLTGITANNKTYDGTRNAVISAGVIGGTVGNETLLISGSGTFDSKNAGTGKTVTVTDVRALIKTDGTGDWDNYNLTTTDSMTTTATIAPKLLGVDIAAVETMYGVNAATGTATLSGVLGSDDVRLTGSTSLVNAVFSSSNRVQAGTYEQTVGAALGGADANNYTAATTTVANYAVTPKVINASVTAADKVYDGNTSATLVATSADILSGDTVNVTGLTGNFASKNVARDGAGNVVAQAVTVTGSAAGLGGVDGANYVLGNAASVPATTARITPRELIVSGITAADKVYDGNTAAVVSAANAALANVVAGDNVAVGTQNAQGNFADKNVARNAAGQVLAKAVLVSGLQLQGADAGNYSLSNDASASAQASITPRTVSLSGNTALDKVVDGTTTAQVRAGSLSGLVSGESLNVNAQGEFEDALVGTNKAVNARFALQDSAAGLAGNYQLSNAVEVLRASIVINTAGLVDPTTGLPSSSGTGNRVVFSGSSGAGAATGVSDEPVNEELLEQCSVLNPERCECEDTKIPGVEMCFAPQQVAVLKD
jgi:filamentous hemagglutinin family protein